MQNAIDQAEAVAANMLGAGEPYVPYPWFWSDQYDLKLQIAGLSTGYDRIVTRGAAPNVSHWYFKSDQFIAVDAINAARDYMVGKRLLEAGKTVEPSVIANPGHQPERPASVRIIGGRLSGLRLTPVGKGDAGAHLRPTTDRVRESLFGTLEGGRFGDPIADAMVLDLFAGTGALGLEALSRGAKGVTFVENGRAALRLLSANIAKAKAEATCRVVRRDARKLGPVDGDPATLVFLDPPYGSGFGEAALEAAGKGGWLAPGALVIWEDRRRRRPARRVRPARNQALWRHLDHLLACVRLTSETVHCLAVVPLVQVDELLQPPAQDAAGTKPHVKIPHNACGHATKRVQDQVPHRVVQAGFLHVQPEELVHPEFVHFPKRADCHGQRRRK